MTIARVPQSVFRLAVAPHPPAAQPGAVAACIEEAHAAERAGRSATARAFYERALRALRSPAEGEQAASLLRWVGGTYRAEGDRSAARDCFRASLTAARAYRSRSDVAHALNWLGILHQDKGRVDASDRFLHAARRYARRAKDRRVLAMIEQNLGINCNIRGALDAALQHYRRALGCYERLGETRYTAQVLNVLGMLYTDLRRWGAAEKSLARSAELCETLGERTTHVMVEVSRAELFATQGALDRARSACDRANALARALGQEPALGEVMRWYGVIDRERGEFEAAETSLRDAHRIAKRHGIRLLEAESQRELALLFRAQSRNREALASLLASRRLFHDLRAERDLAELGRRLDEIERQFLSVVRDWAESIEAKDRYTHGHCNRVAEYGTTLARQFGFDDDTLRWFHMGAFLHDVGKMDVPIAILNKPGRLTDEEFAIMKRHTTAGDAIVADLEFPWDIRPLVRSHHEHWNGRGYPDRLAGEAIPLAARILCVADVFDALTTTRPYRPALTIEEALAVMRDGAGTQFDPAVWTEFEALVTSGLFASVLAA